MPEASLADFQARRLDAPELGAFLRERGEVSTWPPEAWGLTALTRTAFYYSPSLDVARARWGVARGGVVTAGGRSNPSVTGAIGYNATTPPGDIAPWIPEAALDLPIEVAGKRGIRVAEARQRSESARLALLTAAWQLRSRVREAFLDLYVARRADSLRLRQLEIRTETARIVEARRRLGEASPTDVTRARIEREASRVAALDAAQAALTARTALAEAIGVPTDALDGIRLDFDALTEPGPALPPADARRRALVSRTDLLGALADYEASQAALQLEIRKQYPDVSLGPGYQLDQTDSKWTVGLTVSLPVNGNRGPIAEALARREEAAATFLELQAGVLAEVERASADADAAIDRARAADTLQVALEREEAAARSAYAVGEISRLELLGLQAEAVSAALTRLDAMARAHAARGALEDAIQSPLDVGPWVLNAPGRAGGPDEEGS